MNSDDLFDVIVVGAGLAGLTAALRLHQRQKKILVLEASSRIGGRTYSFTSASGDIIDGRGQWIGPEQSAILKLAEELGVSTFPSPCFGKNIMIFEGKRFEFSKSGPFFGFRKTADLVQAIWRLDRLAKKIPIDVPSRANNAKFLDSQTFQNWIDRNTFDTASRFLLNLFSRLNMGVPPSGISLLYVLFKINSAGGFKQLTSMDGGGLAQRFTDGSQAIANKITQILSNSILLTEPVKNITQNESEILITTTKRNVKARKVIIAIDPVQCNKISFNSEMPPLQKLKIENWSMAKGSKTHVVYQRPFWRNKAYSGRAALQNSPVLAVFDNSRPQSDHGVLLVFNDLLTTTTLNQDERRHSILNILASLFGEEALSPIDFVETNWIDHNWIGGCVSSPAPGVLTNTKTEYLRPKKTNDLGIDGRIYFIGAEKSPTWEAHLEAAVRSAEGCIADLNI